MDDEAVSKPPATLSEPRPGILTVTLDRDEKRNAVNPEMTEVLWTAVEALADRDDLRCLVITALGSYFSSGIDLQHGAGRRPPNPETVNLHPGWGYRKNYRSHHLLYDEMETIEKPIVLAAQGPALGWGLETALACDFRFCTPASNWSLPEVRLGALAGSGGTTRLTRLVGPHWAKWMAMAGQQVTADEAFRIGLVHRVIPAATLLDEVYAFCDDIMTIPAETLGLAKTVVDFAGDVGDRGVQRTVDRIVNTALSNGSEEVLRRSAHIRKGAVPPGWRDAGS